MSEAPKDAKETRETRESKEAAEAAAAAAGAAARAVNAPLLVLVAVVVVALGAGAALGGLLVAPKLVQARQAAAAAQLADPNHRHDRKKASKDGKDKKGDPGKSPVYKLDNIIVNPADSQGQRFLMCTVAIESDDAKALDLLREHEIELRDRIVTLLSKQSMDRLTAQNSRDSLRADLLKVVQPVLGPDAADAELKIYLPQFVVQ